MDVTRRDVSHIGRYEIQRRLGVGGMGALYLARDPRLDRLVAIKLLKEDFQDDPQLRERFIREARSVARLRHQNIVVVHDVGEDEGRPFMAMEYIAGETLTRLLQQVPPVPLDRRLAWIEDLCAGLAHAHAAGIIHRDIKPANIMLDGEGVLKILDFGIARLGNSGMTQEGMMMGTLNYMSPEQVAGRGVDHRTDIFAAGAVLYEVISFRQAFPGQIDEGVLRRILSEGPVPLEQVVDSLDPQLAAIVGKALDHDPARRYQDASVMRRDLSRLRRKLAGSEDAAATGSDRKTVLFDPAAASPAGAGPRIESVRPRGLSPERLVELRRQQVEEHLRFGEEAFVRGDHDGALRHAERAATVDPDSHAAIALIDRARLAIEGKAIRHLLGEAQRLLSAGHVDDAAALAEEASSTLPDIHGAADLRQEVLQTLEKISAVRQREARISVSLARAQSSLDEGAYDTALRAVYEALALDPDRAEARALEQQAKSRLQAQRDHERSRGVAHERLVRAQSLAKEGKFEEAVAEIADVSAPSDTVRVAAAAALSAVREAQRLAAQAAVLAAAQAAFERGQFEEARSLVESIPAAERSDTAAALQVEAEKAFQAQERLRQQQQLLEETLRTVQNLVERSDLARALERLEAAAAIGLADDRIPALRKKVADLTAEAEDKRRREERDRAAVERVEAARRLFTAGDGRAAIALLRRDETGHPLVEQALRDIRTAVAAHEERLRKEAERRREEEEARRRAEAEALKRLDEQRKAEEQRRAEEERRAEEQRKAEEQRRAEEQRKAEERRAEERKAEERRRQMEEERRQREAQRLREREEVAKLIAAAEQALSAHRDADALAMLKRADDRLASIEDTDLRRRASLARTEADRQTRQRQAEIRRQQEEARRREEETRRREEETRRREEETRRREQALVEILAQARAASDHQAALDLLNEASALAPGDARVEALVRERRAALAIEREEEERRQQEARRRDEERRAREEQARREAEAEAARVREERAREEDKQRRDREEQQRRERERRDASAAAAIERARLLFADGRQEEALTLLRDGPAHPAVQQAIEELEAEQVRIGQQRQRDLRRRVYQQRRAAAVLAGRRAIASPRMRVAVAAVLSVAVALAIWQSRPAPAPAVEVTPPPVQTEPPVSVPPPAPQVDPRPEPATPPAQPGGGAGTAGGNPPPAKPIGNSPPVQNRPEPARPVAPPGRPGGDDVPAAKDQPVAVEPPTVPPKPEPPVTKPPEAALPLPPPAPAPKPEPPPPSPPSQPDLAADEAAIRQQLSRYVAAYNAMDVTRLREIDPNFKTDLNRVVLKSVELRLSDVVIKVAPDGTAILTATQNFRYEWNRRGPRTSSGPLTWNLRKIGGGAWTVVP